MDPRLLSYYNQELQFIRDSGAEFAAQYPKIAGRLGIDSFDCDDPYVERLLEGFAFLASRIQLKLDAEFPSFTQHLLEMVLPQCLAPLPSMTMVEFKPDLTEGSLVDGYVLPKGYRLKSQLGKDEQTRCIFSTSQDVTLWPIKLVKADYLPRDVATLELPEFSTAKAALVLEFESTAGLTFDQLKLDRLPLFIQGGSDVPIRIYEQVHAHSKCILGRCPTSKESWVKGEGKKGVETLGFDDDQSMLPVGPRAFQGYRLLQEYFAFPERYMFMELCGLQPIIRQCRSERLEIVVLLERGDSKLANRVDRSHFSLFSSPAINLFEKRSDRVQVTHHNQEHHVVVDRTRQMDYEVFDLTSVTGFGESNQEGKSAFPLYQLNDEQTHQAEQLYYTMRREPRVLSSSKKKYGPRSNYIGSESFITLVDRGGVHIDQEIKQLGIKALCTNRDLPLHMPVGVGETDFTMEEGAPVSSVLCLVNPTRPKQSMTYDAGKTSWQLISHLSLNYLSITQGNSHAGPQGGSGAAALRELMSLYANVNDTNASKQIDGVREIHSKAVTRPITTEGPISFGRGLEVTIELDESNYEGTGAFLLASVMERFFAKYVSINSFTETVFKSTERGEVMRWPSRTGRRLLM